MKSPSNAIIDLYQRHADAWTAARGSLLPEQSWVDRFLGLIPPGGEILDLGCGSGMPIAAFAIARGFRVTGVDSAAAMIDHFRVNLPGQTALVADMRTLDLGRSFHGVLAWDSSFHLSRDDQRRMFPIFRNHAAPGAALMFTSGPEDGEAIGTLEGEPLYHASLAPSEYRSLLDENGFRVVGHVAGDPGCVGRTVWLAQQRG